MYKYVLQIPVRDNWWQTETGWAIAGNLVGTFLPFWLVYVFVIDRFCDPYVFIHLTKHHHYQHHYKV
jgi:hypothetical protein